MLFIIFNKKSHFVYLSYGQKIDRPFLWLSKFNKNRFCVDIHEVYDIGTSLSESEKKKIDRLFQKSIRYVISHSTSTKDKLVSMNYSGTILNVPHVHYNGLTELSFDKINEEVRKSILPNRVNILFFGHLRRSKGISKLFELMNNVENQDLLEKFNIVIAGNDTKNIIGEDSLKFKSGISNAQILRYISDEEMAFLYSESDYCILPYSIISQSGVVEMAVQFQTPLLLSDIPEFEQYINDHPSFGHLFSIEKQHEFEELLNNISQQSTDYYKIEEVEVHKNKSAFDSFAKSFRTDFLKI